MKHWYIVILCATLLFTGCDEESNYGLSSVPSAPVQYTVYVTRENPGFVIDHGFQVLSPITTKRYEYDYIGYAGLLIWVGMDNAYHAADLCCPNCINRSKPVESDGGLFVTCPVCKEQYDISYGLSVPTKGIAREALKQYTVIERNSVTGLELQITN